MANLVGKNKKYILASIVTIAVTTCATLLAAHLPLPLGIPYHDHNPVVFVSLVGLPAITILVAAKLGMDWKRYTLVLLLVFALLFMPAWGVFAILGRLR